MILIASAILVLIGVTHSYLGERYILMRLFRRDNIPHLLGSDHFTKGTLRFCWHILSLVAFGFAAILYNKSSNDVFTLCVIGTVFMVSALLSIYFTKGKHLSWIAFLAVSGICFVEAYAV
ncbi:hypothetical protein [Aliiglaciecola sp. M165]|uniref:hypothetical protein n=1 Tax=Aliiglaciecola sp. M165 TaxID=2593649 RepID=UPI00117EFBBF|nr:hypothetical protein [Aliiglaciecola sp. M165]TRY33456.1 hypothetical protein FM019_05640 [Aliiglaciecola sp. M165]